MLRTSAPRHRAGRRSPVGLRRPSQAKSGAATRRSPGPRPAGATWTPRCRPALCPRARRRGPDLASAAKASSEVAPYPTRGHDHGHTARRHPEEPSHQFGPRQPGLRERRRPTADSPRLPGLGHGGCQVRTSATGSANTGAVADRPEVRAKARPCRHGRGAG